MQLVILIGPPDAGLTLVASVIARRKRFAALPAGRLLTALAHVGIGPNIDKAAYDHVLAGPAQRQFLQRVEGGSAAWPHAMGAYVEEILRAASAVSDAPYLLDTAPEYARLWPLLCEVVPELAPIILVRNPVATAAEVLSQSQGTREENHLLDSWRQLARVMRESDNPTVLRYENILRAPEAELACLIDRFGSNNSSIISYEGRLDSGVERESAWPHELAANRELRHCVRCLLERLSAQDLETMGYAWEDAWEPVESALGQPVQKSPVRRSWLTFQRNLQVCAARAIAKRPRLLKKLRALKLATDVLLRE